MSETDAQEGSRSPGEEGLDAPPSPEEPPEKASEKAQGEAQARLEELRKQIVALDEELIRLVGRRRDLVLEVGRIKEALELPVLDPGREAQVVRRAAELSRKLGVDEELTRDVIWRIMASAREAQEGDRSWGPPDYPPPEGSAAPSPKQETPDTD